MYTAGSEDLSYTVLKYSTVVLTLFIVTTDDTVSL